MTTALDISWNWPLSGIIAGVTMGVDRGDITLLLDRMNAGDRSAEEALMPRVYMELHRLAASRMRNERPGHTIQPTALVHEVYMRLCRTHQVEWEDRAHFFRAAGRLMRHILVDYARQRRTQKRNEGEPTLGLVEAITFSPEQFTTAIEVDEVLQQLAKLDQRQAQIVEMRFFAGLTESEIAEALDISERTVKRNWLIARAWLHQKLKSK